MCATTPARLGRNITGVAGLITVLLWAAAAPAQIPAGGAGPSAPAAAAAVEPKNDPLGRTTPRGTVRAFLGAARRGEDDLAAQYLNTRLAGERAAELAHQLFVVLDRRLPTPSTLSDAPEGSQANPDNPALEIAGTIASAAGNVDIVLEQRLRADGVPIWLFSRTTLQSIPAVYQEISLAGSVVPLPSPLLTTRIGGIRLVEWAVMLVALALFYPATVLLNRALTALVRRFWRAGFERSSFARRGVVPAPARLLLMALLVDALLSLLPFSLLSRQLWSSAVALVTITCITWLLLLIGGEVEHSIRRRVPDTNAAAAISLLHLGRRSCDVLVILAALFATLRHFGIDPTPALAGLGVGGIAVALAAQKTLENVIAGASLIFDRAVRVGDFLKMGETVGTVEYIGLRSTRIRTQDRSLVSVPNSQIANTTLETLSARDKYLFHPIVALRYDTSAEQLQTILREIHRLLSEQRTIDPETPRVRLLRLGTFSLDIEVFAYIFARDWNHFMEVQEQLLVSVTEIVERAGAAIALPSQTMYISDKPVPAADPRFAPRTADAVTADRP